MNLLKVLVFSLLLNVVLPWGSPAQAAPGIGQERMDILFLCSDVESTPLAQVTANLHLNSVQQGLKARVSFYCRSDIRQRPNEVQTALEQSPLVVMDVMIPEVTEFVLAHLSPQDWIHKTILAVRGSRDDQSLAQKGIVFDPKVQAYYRQPTIQNLKQLIYFLLAKYAGWKIDYDPPLLIPKKGLYHPQAPTIFNSFQAYERWYTKWLDEQAKNSPHGLDPARHCLDRAKIGLLTFSSMVLSGQQQPLNELIHTLERAGFAVYTCYGFPAQESLGFFLDARDQSRVDLILSFALKFSSSINPQVKRLLKQLNVPLINAQSLYLQTIPQWESSPQGLQPLEVSWSLANPELSGLIEPSVLLGKQAFKDPKSNKTLYQYKLIKKNLKLLIPRLKKWLALQDKPNQEKKAAILYYNHSQGKQNIGASYLNVFASLKAILHSMRKAGYQVDIPPDFTQDKLRSQILRAGRNIGSWAPGELEKLASQGEVVKLPLATYKRWFAKLPKKFRDKVLKQWGAVESSKIMIQKQKIIIPALRLGNIVLMPEPARGWGDDPMKLYHSPTLYPHHQYIAAYLWLKYQAQVDAMIHLGTHATHEWLPGKQAGLSWSCPPEVLITDIPNIYPYIVDDVGEGIQAKRRGRGLIVDHLTPPFARSGIFAGYQKLYEQINDYNRAQARGSTLTDSLWQEISNQAKDLGLLTDLGLNGLTPGDLEKLEHYLLEIKYNFIPYGLHTFGSSPTGQALQETRAAICNNIPSARPKEVEHRLLASGPSELKNLLQALQGEYIPSGQGNDPLQNLEAIPTGKDFYGFDPQKIPSKTAWGLGCQAAQKIIDQQRKKDKTFPSKVAIVLWATETIRNQGVNESTILCLLGIRPKWDQSGRVTGLQVIPGPELGRPRIDVLINPSGLYRDLFPNFIHLLDKAVALALMQRDIKNLLLEHSQQIQKVLEKNGVQTKEAQRLARVRIFGERPGSYGTGVPEMTGNSGLWEQDQAVVQVYENRTSSLFGQGFWGQSNQQLLKLNLKGVDVALHSISSNLYRTMDNDDVFQYLGGLSLAVAKERGKAPKTLITMRRQAAQIQVEGLAKVIGRELRSRYLNPKWITGMKKEKYAGAREMAKFIENMWGWQVTTPKIIDKHKWEQSYAVYVLDKYGLKLKEFFNQYNPWAYQSLTARMLEAVRKGYWQASKEIQTRLAKEYVLNVLDKGVACCDHTCNNPLLNQMVVNLVSLPGVLSPELVEQFKLAVARAAKMPLSAQVLTRKQLLSRLNASAPSKRPHSRSKSQKDQAQEKPQAGQQAKDQEKTITGYKMEEVKNNDQETKVSSSGVQWLAAIFVLALLALFLLGVHRQQKQV